MIYDYRIRLESFSRDLIGYGGSPYLLYEYGEGVPLTTVDPVGKWTIIAKEVGKRVVIPAAK